MRLPEQVRRPVRRGTGPRNQDIVVVGRRKANAGSAAGRKPANPGPL